MIEVKKDLMNCCDTVMVKRILKVDCNWTQAPFKLNIGNKFNKSFLNKHSFNNSNFNKSFLNNSILKFNKSNKKSFKLNKD
jgi:hypothetical protein